MNNEKQRVITSSAGLPEIAHHFCALVEITRLRGAPHPQRAASGEPKSACHRAALGSVVPLCAAPRSGRFWNLNPPGAKSALRESAMATENIWGEEDEVYGDLKLKYIYITYTHTYNT